MKKILKTILVIALIQNFAIAEDSSSAANPIDNYNAGNTTGGKLMNALKSKDSKKNDPLNVEVDPEQMKKAFTTDPELSMTSFNQTKRDKIVDKIKDSELERNLDQTIKRAECKKLKEITQINECLKNLNK